MQHGTKLKEVDAAEPTHRLPSSILDRYQAALARFLNDHFSDLIPWLKVREKVEVGRPDKAIVQRAKIEGSDLIVIATHGRSGLAHILLGSVTEKVVRTAPCPVLTIRDRATASP
jgi:nucleotide-binding universal stress UspA family protein